MKGWLRAWPPVLLWMGVIYFISAQPSLPRLPEPLWQTLLTKGAHFGEYLVLALLLQRALLSGGGFVRGRVAAAWVALLVSLLYGISDELHQSLVPNRNASALDVGIDTLGAGLGLLGVHHLRRSGSGPLPEEGPSSPKVEVEQKQAKPAP